MMCLRTVVAPHSCKFQLNASTYSFCETIFGFAFFGPTLHECWSHFMFVYVVSALKFVPNAEGTFLLCSYSNDETKKPKKN